MMRDSRGAVQAITQLEVPSPPPSEFTGTSASGSETKPRREIMSVMDSISSDGAGAVGARSER